MFLDRGKSGRFTRESGNRRRVVSAFCAAALLLVSHPHAQAQSLEAEEYRAKARALANIPNFIEWEGSELPPAGEPFLICVYGNYPFSLSLAEMVRSLEVQGRRVNVRSVHQEKDAQVCQMLFVLQMEHKRYGTVLQALESRSVLTVGEDAAFLNAGGMVSLAVEGGVIHFKINLAAAKRAHLKIHSQLLAMARRTASVHASTKD